MTKNPLAASLFSYRKIASRSVCCSDPEVETPSWKFRHRGKRSDPGRGVGKLFEESSDAETPDRIMKPNTRGKKGAHYPIPEKVWGDGQKKRERRGEG